MKVHGMEISQETKDDVVKRMRKGDFCSADIASLVYDQLPASPTLPFTKSEVAHRVADRMIQRERKAKNISIARYPRWEWCGTR